MPNDPEPEYRWRIRKQTNDQYENTRRKQEDDERHKNRKWTHRVIREICGHAKPGENEEDRRWRYERNLQVFEILALILAAAVGTAAIIVGNLDAGRQRDVMQDQLTLAYPPRLIVTNFVVWQADHPRDAPLMRPREKIDGYVWVASAGRETATITDTLCRVFWLTEPLPMYRPYNDMTNNHEFDRPTPLTNSDALIMRPGDLSYWQVNTIIPEYYTTSWHLYIMGYIIYHDRLNTRRGIFFARKYDPSERRFIKATDNPDYESEE